MENKIKCPSCGHQFEATDAIRDEVQRELNLKAKDWQSKKEEEYKKKEEEIAKKHQEEMVKQKLQMEELIRKNVAADYELQLKMLKESNESNEIKLKESRNKELEFLRKEAELKNKTAELEIEVEKKLMAGRDEITQTIRKQEAEKNELKQKEYEKKMEDQRKMIEEMQRKIEQGSMQMQGEVMELALEDLLKTEFKFDIIDEVKKGASGADVVQTVVNSSQQICGKIIFESKRTKTFSDSWIEKLKNDQREEGASLAVLVTEVMPKDMTRFGSKDGVWICNFQDAKSLVHILREMIVREYSVRSAEENKGDKMSLLYQYITSEEFRHRVEAIVEAFSTMKSDIDTERRLFTKRWKEREKQIEIVMNNTINMYGSVKGIAGNAVGNVKALEIPEFNDGENEELE
jgi:hypothetical protein